MDEISITQTKDENNFRWYNIDGDPYISVTTALDVITNADSRNFFLGQTKSGFDTLMETTSSLGTEIHTSVENYHNNGDTDFDDRTAPAMKSYLYLVNKHKIKVSMMERPVFSKKYGYAGTMDMLAEVDGKMCVCDLKTGKFQFTHAFQVAAYRMAGIEMGLWDHNVGSCIIYAHRRGDSARIYTHKQHEFLFTQFLSALWAHQGQYPNQYRKLQKNYKYTWKSPLETFFAEKFNFTGFPEPEDFS